MSVEGPTILQPRKTNRGCRDGGRVGSQHAKLDTLVVDEIATRLGRKKIESLQTATGRTLTPAERKEIEREQVKSYRWTFLLSEMTHPNFDRSLRELSDDGHRRVAELGR
jgi:hypothetical protein